jgi:hypothetical protein
MKTRASLVVILASAVLLALSSPAGAQDRTSIARAILREVAFDPTTYAAATISFEAERLDWRSSQIFFAHGFVEHNPQFTVSGLPDDLPLGYAAGNRQIVTDALMDLGTSVENNVIDRIIERILIERYPRRRKLFRTLGWIERISFASTLATTQSAGHFRQWRENERRTRELGY